MSEIPSMIDPNVFIIWEVRAHLPEEQPVWDVLCEEEGGHEVLYGSRLPAVGPQHQQAQPALSPSHNKIVKKLQKNYTKIDHVSRWKKCGWDIMRIFDLHNSKARYELKVVLLDLWRVNVKTIGGFIDIPLADLPHINLRHNNITLL